MIRLGRALFSAEKLPVSFLSDTGLPASLASGGDRPQDPWIRTAFGSLIDTLISAY